MINNYLRIVLCGIICFGLTTETHSKSQCGPAINAFIQKTIAGYFGERYARQTSASDKTAIMLKVRPFKEVNTKFEICYEEDDILEYARSGALDAVGEESQKIAYRITGNITLANRITSDMQDEAASMIHPSGSGSFGCLSGFTGKALEQKIRNRLDAINSKSEQDIKQKALEYLSLYASPFSQHTIDLNNLTNLPQRIAQQDSSTAGNITAIANLVAEKLRGKNPSVDTIKAEIFGATREHIRKTVINKANAAYHDNYKTERIVDSILKEFDRESAYLRDYGISTAIIGKLAKFFGESLESKIKEHHSKIS